MEEYNGSIRESTNPCHIDRDFIDNCSACRSSMFNIDIEISNLSNLRVIEAIEIIKENVPFHAIYNPKGKGDEVIDGKTDKRGVVIINKRATTEQNADYLMDRYTLHQLTSTRYLALGLKQKEKDKKI